MLTSPLTPRLAVFRCVLGALIALVMVGWAQAQVGTDAEITRHYQERRERLIGAAIATIDELYPAKGAFLDVAAALQRGENLAAARKRLTVLNEPRPTGNMFWMYPIMAVLLNGDEHLDEANRRLAQNATDARLWIAGTQHHGAWLSRDGGATWTQTDPGSAKANLYAVALNPQAAPVMAVGGWDVGVRISTDGGGTWSDRSAGLPTKHVFVLAFDPDVRGRLWASAFEEGSFYSDDLGLTWLDGGLDGAYGFDYVFVPSAHR